MNLTETHKSVIVLIFLALLSQVGCTTGASLKARAGEIEEIVDRIYPRAYLCAPQRLAIAEANVDFARHELAKGDFVRARSRLNIAEENAKEADSLSNTEVCSPSPLGVAPAPSAAAPVSPVVEAPKLKPTAEDRDGDGIVDAKDRCPDEPEDLDGFQDDDGCPDLDNDGDGIPDTADKCPNVAEDKDGYQDDDGCPELDNDGDGFPDAADKCPNDAEDFDGYQDDDGCPEPDNDGDGVSDLNDLCPSEPETYNGFKDGDGCPDKEPLAKIEGDSIKLNQKVFFKSGKDTILSQSYPLLNDVADILTENPTVKIRIEGHTDSRGRESRNKRLSEARAAAVRTYLLGRGIALERMEAVGFGEERPIDDNSTKEGRANNRRVEIHITGR